MAAVFRCTASTGPQELPRRDMTGTPQAPQACTVVGTLQAYRRYRNVAGTFLKGMYRVQILQGICDFRQAQCMQSVFWVAHQIVRWTIYVCVHVDNLILETTAFIVSQIATL